MLTDAVRKALEKANNRFELVVVASERCRQVLLGARPTVDNPARERVTKVALREIIAGHIVREGDHWRVPRTALPEIFLPPPPRLPDAAEILGLKDDEEEDEEDDEDDDEEEEEGDDEAEDEDEEEDEEES